MKENQGKIQNGIALCSDEFVVKSEQLLHWTWSTYGRNFIKTEGLVCWDEVGKFAAARGKNAWFYSTIGFYVFFGWLQVKLWATCGALPTARPKVCLPNFQLLGTHFQHLPSKTPDEGIPMTGTVPAFKHPFHVSHQHQPSGQFQGFSILNRHWQGGLVQPAGLLCSHRTQMLEVWGQKSLYPWFPWQVKVDR